VQSVAAYPLITGGTDEQKRRYLPRLASGEITAAFSLSEPAAGSDAARIATTAVRKGDRYLLNGSKMWVTNGSHAGLVTLFAASLIDHGASTALESSMAKCFASDAAMKVTTDAVPIFGGYGYTREYPVERLMRDAKITQIYEGTNQIQGLVIARELGARA
jgi:alkylation response protein AidB-like acyl-CoA dehydrogenase